MDLGYVQLWKARTRGCSTRRIIGHMKLDRLTGRFFGAAGMSLALRVAWAVVNYAGVVLLARWLTGEAYGRYGFIMSLIIFLGIVCGLGAQTTLLRFLGQYYSEKKPGLARGAIIYSRRLVFKFTSAVAGLGAIIALVLWGLGTIEAGYVYAIGFAILPAFTQIDVQSGVARSYRAVFTALAPKDVLWRASLIPLGLAVTLWLEPPLELPVLLAGSAILITVASLGQGVSARRIVPPEVKSAPAQMDPIEWRSVARPIWLAAIANTALKTVDVIILGLVLPPLQVGWYFAASRTAALVSFVLQSTNLVVGPEVSRLYHAGEMGPLKRLLKLGALAVFLPSAAACLLCIVLAEYILSAFGPDFVNARGELIILALGQAVNASTGCVGIVMNMTGHHRKAAEIQVSTAAAATVAIGIGAVIWGTMGAAAAAASGLVVWNLRMWWYVRRTVGIDPSIAGILVR